MSLINNHINKIPKIIHMCHKELTYIKIYSKNWEKLNPEYEIKLYDDELCKQFLLHEFSQLYCDIFNFLQNGPIKCDFWRICILYKYGGIYVDSDIEQLVPLKSYIEEDIDFCTCIIGTRQYNPHFIATNSNNIHLKLCIDKYIEQYNNKQPYSYWGYSIVPIFNNVVKDIEFHTEGLYTIKNKKYQLLKNVIDGNLENEHGCYNNIRIFNNRYKNYDPGNHRFRIDPIS